MRTLRKLTFSAGLYLLISLIDSSVLAQLPPDPNGEPRWILATDRAITGKAIEAWLVLPARNPPVNVEVSLISPSSLHASLRKGSPVQSCEDQAHSRWTGRLASSKLLPVCIIGKEPGTHTLIATITLRDGHDTLQSYPTITVEMSPAFRLNETLRSILVALLAFAGGVSTSLIVKSIEHRSAKQQTERELETMLFKSLADELLTNLERLQVHFAAKSASAPILHSSKSALLLDAQHGMTALLRSPNQIAILRSLRNLYTLIGEYNRAARLGESSRIDSLGRKVLDRLTVTANEVAATTATAGEEL